MESQERLLEQFQAALRAKNRQPATVESYARDAQDFLRYLHQSGLGLQAVEPQTLLWFRDHLLHDGKEAENSVRRKVIGVRQFYRFLAEERLILDSPFDAMPLPASVDRVPLRGQPGHVGRGGQPQLGQGGGLEG